MEIFLIIALVIFVLAVAKWNQEKDKPIEFDTPELKARREKFKNGVCWVTNEVKDFCTKPSNNPNSGSF